MKTQTGLYESTYRAMKSAPFITVIIEIDQNNQKSCRLVLCWCRSVHCFFILTQKHNQRTTLRPYILTKEATAQVT